MVLVRQNELQRRGGVCAAYPSSCLVRKLLGQAGLFKPFQHLRVLDLTFGQGIFYYSFRSKVQVYGFDIRRLDWVVKPYRFYNASCDKWKKQLPSDIDFDLVVVDPPFSPYKRGQEKRTHYRDNGSISLCFTEALKAAERFAAPLLVHFMWKTQPYGFKVLSETWFQGWSLTKMARPTWFGVLSSQ